VPGEEEGEAGAEDEPGGTDDPFGADQGAEQGKRGSADREDDARREEPAGERLELMPFMILMAGAGRSRGSEPRNHRTPGELADAVGERDAGNEDQGLNEILVHGAVWG
jgi:hypothetical protein